MSLTLIPALDPFPLFVPSRPAPTPGGGVRPLSRVGGSTCGGCKPAGNVVNPVADDALPCGDPDARASYEYDDWGDDRRPDGCGG